jgi:hypothetical protein
MRRLDRSQLPDEFTADTVRAMGMRTARMLARPDNGVLTPSEQADFDRALREVLQDSTDRLGRSLVRVRRGGPSHLDPELRRSYLRTQRRLDAQAARARRAFPQLTDEWDDHAPGEPDGVDTAPTDVGPSGDGHDGDSTEGPGVTPGSDDGSAADDDVSIGTFEAQIDQTSDTMELLEQIATIQQQQLEHQRSKLRGETRQLFFGLAVSVAVIIAGIAPLVAATPDERRLILAWTAGVCIVAGLVYAVVRAVQARAD